MIATGSIEEQNRTIMVRKSNHGQPAHDTAVGPFTPGQVVLVTLNMPREKYWGVILAISTAGIALRGVDLNSFDDFARIVKSGEPAAPHSVFFPMHRVERAEVDARNGDIPSLQERFFHKTGHDFIELFVGSGEGNG